MSAPESVRTKDGITWTLRTVTSSGIALYAPKGVCECPDFVMATLAELAEHGIQSAELAAAVAEHGAFPMPVGPGPQELPAERLAEIRSLDLLALLSDRAAPVVSGHLAALLDEVTRLRAERAAIGDEVARFGIYGAALPATKALVKRADELVTENAGLRARIAALLEERRSTNEALDDAVQALRADRQGPALPWAASMDDGDLSMFLGDLVSAAMGRWRSEPEVPDRVTLADIEKVCADWRTPGEGYRSEPEPDGCVCPPADQPGPHQFGCPLAEVPRLSERPVNELTAAFTPMPVLREVLDGEHWSIVHHDYRVGHDLPELGGAS